MSVCVPLCVSVSVCSYKEHSDDATDSDDLIEVEWTEADHEREAAETIEKVIRHRLGHKGGKFSVDSTSVCDFCHFTLPMTLSSQQHL